MTKGWQMKVLLFGDSITEYIPKDKLNVDWSYNQKKNAENGVDNFDFYKCGAENYATDMLRKYVFPKVNTQPYDIIVLQCGINDFFWPYYDEDYPKKSPEEIFQEIASFAEEIKETSHKKVMVESLYPVKNGKVTNQEDIVYINKRLEAFCKANGYKFIDMYSSLVGDDGNYARGLSDDDLHPNARGYEIVAEKLNRILTVENQKEREL